MMRPSVCVLAVLTVAIAACSVADQQPSSTTTTTSTGGPIPVVVAPRGLLPYEVGGPAAPVVDGLTELVGGPDNETPWVDAGASVFGRCPGLEVRGIGWGSLYVLEQRTGDGETFFGWTYGFDYELAESGDQRRLDLKTTDGIGLGSTRSELESALGNRLTVVDDEAADITSFLIDGTEPEHIRGRLSGPGQDDVVDFLESVPGCE
jgi:hypothetical protein